MPDIYTPCGEDAVFIPYEGECDDCEQFAQRLNQLDEEMDTKQDILTAGEGIEIENNVISSTGGGASPFVIHQVSATTPLTILETYDEVWNAVMTGTGSDFPIMFRRNRYNGQYPEFAYPIYFLDNPEGFEYGDWLTFHCMFPNTGGVGPGYVIESITIYSEPDQDGNTFYEELAYCECDYNPGPAL